uniref:Uncharacterized protein n=1 Tax=Apteryx owenii TaxID=8824 RepID=A0A8B9Q441_APTOW
MVSVRSLNQPVVVKGEWTKRTHEEMKLIDIIQHTEVLQYTMCEYSTILNIIHVNWAYLNGYKPDQRVYASGKTLLDSCTFQLNVQQPAKALCTPEGELLKSHTERHGSVCFFRKTFYEQRR